MISGAAPVMLSDSRRTAMTVPTILRSRAWQLFLLGASTVPVWDVIAGFVSAPEWRTRTVYTDHVWALLMLLSLLACVAAPFFTALPMQRRIGFAVLGALGFVASAVLSLLASLVVFGVPID
jgi:hypothetical protein